MSVIAEIVRRRAFLVRRSVGGVSLPVSFTNLHSWWRADNQYCLDAGGDPCAADEECEDFTPMSGSFNLNSVGAARPIWKSSAIGSQPALEFSSDSMATVDFGGDLSQPNTLIIVCKQSSTSGTQAVVDGINTSKRAMTYSVAANHRQYAGATLNSGIAPNTNRKLWISYYNTTSSKTRINGVDGSTGDAGSHVLSGLTLGSNFSQASFFVGQVAEVVLINGLLPDGERDDFESYATDRYGAF